ncbi:MAG: cupin domain-containing protein [Anaerolineales bacterium]
MSEYKLIENILKNAPETPGDSILSQTLYLGPDARVILFQFAPGQELSEHTAAKPAMLHFLEGEAVLTLGGDISEVGKNAFVHMPANLPHSILAKTAVSMLLIMVG